MKTDHNITAYPLAWPTGVRRTPPSRRTSDRFTNYRRDLTIAAAIDRVTRELKTMRIPDYNVIVSSNLVLGARGLPLSAQRQPDDPGVAVYFRDSRVDGHPQRVIATDIYNKVEANLAGIAKTLEAFRAIERHGGAAILDRAFTGFTALPSPERHWSDILDIPPTSTRALIEQAYRRARSKHHPDNGGRADDFDAVQRAYEQACAEVE